ncbi:MAG: hypothetical protein HYZ53_04500 [Planctomycetes bacterium]|nr:hypothetical protein [Planctomycetota bacterium]
MTNRFLRQPAFLVALLAGLLPLLSALGDPPSAPPADAPAEGAFVLRTRVENGEKWTVTSERRVGLDLEVADAEGKKSRQSLVTSRNHRYVREVETAADGTATRLKLNYILARETRARSGQVQLQSETLPLEGKVFRFERAEGGLHRECLNDAAYPEARMNEMSFEESYEQLLPPTPVKVGESWSPEGGEAARFLVGDYVVTPKEGTVRCTLERLEGDGARRAAIVTVVLTLSGRSGGQAAGGGYELEANLAGQLEFVTSTGKPRSFRLGGKLKATGAEIGARGESVATVQTEGTINLSVQYQTGEDAATGEDR